MARRKVDPVRQRLVMQIEANGMEVGQDWPTEVLEKLAEYCPPVQEPKPEVYGAPKRERRRGPARIEFHAPELVSMTQGSGELITSNSHASYIAGMMSEGMGHPERNYQPEHEKRKRLFPEGSTTPGADVEHQLLRAWARRKPAIDAGWSKEILRTLRAYSME